MRKNKKIMGGFIAILHCCLMALPLLVLVFNTLKIGVTQSLSYETTYVYDNEGNYQESSREYSFNDYVIMGFRDTLIDFHYIDEEIINTYEQNDWDNATSELWSFPFVMDIDFLSLFSVSSNEFGESIYIYFYINFYLNWLINMSVIVFVPELILVFIDICRKLVYSFSHKIDGGF